MYSALDEDTLTDHRPGLVRLARSLVDPADAEDVVQDALLAAQTAQGVRHPGAWLRSTVRRIASKRHRTKSRLRTRESGAARPEPLPSTHEIAAALETQRRVLAALQSLPDPQRQVLWYRYFDDLPPRVIAKQTETPLATIKSRLHRGLEAMRVQLDGSHEGSRTKWRAALAPLLHAPLPGVRAGGLSVLSLGALFALVAGATWWALSRGTSTGDVSAALVMRPAAETTTSGMATLMGSRGSVGAHATVPERLVSTSATELLDLETRPSWTLDILLDLDDDRSGRVDLGTGTVTLRPTTVGGTGPGPIAARIQQSESGWVCRLDLSVLAKLTPGDRAGLAFTLHLQHAQAAFAHTPEWRPPIWPGRSYRRLELDCTSGEARTITVLSGHNEPVSGAVVVIVKHQRPTRTRHDSDGRWTTDARGQCLIARPSWDETSLAAYHPQHGQARALLHDVPDGTLRLSASRWVEGRISLVSGEAVPHLLVRVQQRDDPTEFVRSQYTDRSGRFRIAVAHDGACVLEMVGDGAHGPTYEVPIQVGSANELRLPWSGLILNPVPVGTWSPSSLPLTWWVPDGDHNRTRPNPDAPLLTSGTFERPRYPVTLLGIPDSPVMLQYGEPSEGVCVERLARFPAGGLSQVATGAPAPPEPGDVHLSVELPGGDAGYIQDWRILHKRRQEVVVSRRSRARSTTRLAAVLSELPPGEWRLWLHVVPSDPATGGAFGLCRPYVPITVRSGQVTLVTARVLPATRLLVRWSPTGEATPAYCHVVLRRVAVDGSHGPWRTHYAEHGVSPNKWLKVPRLTEPGRYHLRFRIGSGEYEERTVTLLPGTEHREEFEVPGD